MTRTFYDDHDRALGRVTLEQLDDGGLNLETAYTHDAAGNLAQVRDARGITTTFEYNELNQLVKRCRDAGGLNLCTTYTYDSLGNQETVTDPNGVTTKSEYNTFGLPERVITDYGTDPDDLNVSTRFAYDNALNLRRLTDANGNETWYAWAPRNQVAAEHYADDTAVGYTYDGRGNVDVRTLQDGQAITHTYDTVGRVTNKALSASGWQTYTYDAEGRLLTAEETLDGHSSALAYSYNALGDVISTTQRVDGVSWQVLYEYDYAGGVYTVTYPSNVKRAYELDPLGRLDAVRLGDGTAVADYAYHDVDGYTVITYANGLTARVDYDTLGRTMQITSAVGGYAYGYDGAGNRTYVQRLHETGQPADVYDAYDDLYQLTQVWYSANATDTQSITSYDYRQVCTLDALGNRVGQTDALGNTTTYIYDDLNRLLETVSAEGMATTRYYDEVGRVITTTRTLDGVPVTTVSHYNALGNRVGQTDARGNTTTYI